MASIRSASALVAALIPLAVALPPFIPRSDPSRSLTSLPLENLASSIHFGPCPDDVPTPLECAKYSVPINWDEPGGEHFDLGLIRLPATGEDSQRIGSLFVNPGGPGGSATELVAELLQFSGLVPTLDQINDAFDIVGLDPRGVGSSNAVTCDQKIWAERVSWFPKTQDEYNALVDKNKRYGQSCRNMTGPLVEFVDTISVVKDHEAVRIALGNKPLNMVGLSYGSQLGAQYAALFPDNIRTLVLDGILQHSQADSANNLIESLGYVRSLVNFFKWASADKTSALRGKDVKALWFSLLKKASKHPLAAPACDGSTCRTDVTAEEILFNAQDGLLSTDHNITEGTLSNWGSLASALLNTSHGDASAFSTAYESTDAGIAISCLDLDHDPDVYDFAYMRAKQQLFNTLAPLTKGASETTSILHSCVGWPIAPRNPPQKLHVDTKTTILMVNSDADPNTGYGWAVGMLEEIRNKAFVTRIGDGHTSTFTGGKTADVIAEYLLSGKAPENGLVLDS